MSFTFIKPTFSKVNIDFAGGSMPKKHTFKNIGISVYMEDE